MPRLRAAYGLEGQVSIVLVNPLYGAGEGGHPRRDVHPLEGGTGGAGSAYGITLRHQQHLAVGAHVDEKEQASAPGEPQRDQTGDGIGAEMAGYSR